jgi:cytochrome c-type biogenesis protein CcmH
MKRFGLGCLLALMVAIAPAWAVFIDTPLGDPAAEARAQRLMQDLRCLVCQNQSIRDSNASLARDLRVIVRERIGAGDSDEQAMAYIVNRYGDWVLLDPPFKLTTLGLWFGPFVLLGLAGFGVVVLLRRRRQQPAPAPAPLSAQEQARLTALLDETE